MWLTNSGRQRQVKGFDRVTHEKLLKIVREFRVRTRLLEPTRWAAMTEFRSVCDGAFDALGIRPDRAFEDIMAEIRDLDRKTVLIADLLAGLEPNYRSWNEMFGVDMDAYKALEEAVSPIKKPVPEKIVLMTFDDATVDHLELAGPILRIYGGFGNFFICEMERGLTGGPGFYDKQYFMTWAQIKALEDQGHEIANHSLHHSFGFADGTDEYVKSEISGMEERCTEHRIHRPGSFGYPGGRCTPRLEKLLRGAGYIWARGDMVGDRFERSGQACYDPYIDSPLAMPSYNNAPMFTKERLARVLDNASDGRVAILAYHTVNSNEFIHMTFEEQVRAIYDMGGKCITFSQLEEYVDPEKAYKYSHLGEEETQ